ncbi:trace amine-associated receptor 1-like [Chanos chanos]|uniref:Trace amine-associated receptor 1 n=1 Tax=Chanos chanos TaxID=29144 RepID=A0A6J2W3I6_CHACN|nr:trace amine-associated receptor 1-like [Chanos chanos]
MAKVSWNHPVVHFYILVSLGNQFCHGTLYILFVVIILLTNLGNLLVIITIIHFKRLHKPTNYLILSLAVADLLVGMFVMPPSMVRVVETCWYFGDFYYRYYAVCHPLQYQNRITPFITVIMISVCWSISITFAVVLVFAEDETSSSQYFLYGSIPCEKICVILLSEVAILFYPVFIFYAPSTIILSIYLKIFSAARKQIRLIHGVNSQIKTRVKQTSISKAERKTTKTLVIIMSVFLICWTPIISCSIIDPLTGHSVPSVLFEVFGWIGYSNSSLNPIVYVFFYSEFRKAFRMILCRKRF